MIRILQLELSNKAVNDMLIDKVVDNNALPSGKVVIEDRSFNIRSFSKWVCLAGSLAQAYLNTNLYFGCMSTQSYDT